MIFRLFALVSGLLALQFHMHHTLGVQVGSTVCKSHMPIPRLEVERLDHPWGLACRRRRHRS